MDNIVIIGVGNIGSVALATALEIHGLGVIAVETKAETFEPEPEVFEITRRELPDIDIELIRKEADKHPFQKFIGKPKHL